MKMMENKETSCNGRIQKHLFPQSTNSPLISSASSLQCFNDFHHCKNRRKNMSPALQCRRQRSASQFSILVNRTETDSVSDYSSWTGVNCSNQTDQVIRLDPGCSNLSGPIHPGFYNLLMLALLTLDLSNNRFHRLIQTELANVSEIEVLVRIGNRDLGDRIPDWIGVNKVHLPMQKITSFYKPRHESHMHIQYKGSDCLPQSASNTQKPTKAADQKYTESSLKSNRK